MVLCAILSFRRQCWPDYKTLQTIIRATVFYRVIQPERTFSQSTTTIARYRQCFYSRAQCVTTTAKITFRPKNYYSLSSFLSSRRAPWCLLVVSEIRRNVFFLIHFIRHLNIFKNKMTSIISQLITEDELLLVKLEY